MAGRLLCYLDFLRSKTVGDIPCCIRAKTMPGYGAPASIASTDGDVVIHAGQDPHASASTVAALMLWLCGSLQALSDVPPSARRPFSSLDSFGPLPPKDHLLVVSTPFHAFAFLCVDAHACLLHSNQDTCAIDDKGTTLWDCLENPRLLTPAEFRGCLERLTSALADAGTCREVCTELFGVPWTHRGDPSEYWFATLPVRPVQDLA